MIKLHSRYAPIKIGPTCGETGVSVLIPQSISLSEVPKSVGNDAGERRSSDSPIHGSLRHSTWKQVDVFHFPGKRVLAHHYTAGCKFKRLKHFTCAGI